MVNIENKYLRTLVIALIISSMTYVGLLYAHKYDAGASFWPAAGFYIAYYYVYKNDALPGILIGLLLTNFIYRLIVVDESIFISLIVSMIFVLGNFVEMILFNYLMNYFNVVSRKLQSVREISKFLLVTVIVTLVGGIISVSAMPLLLGSEGLVEVYTLWVIGNATGITIFSSLLIHSHHGDESFKTGVHKSHFAALYIVVFMLIVVFLFGDYGHNYLTFESFQILIVIMYILTAFIFSYRMIIMNNIMILISIYFLHLAIYTGDDLPLESLRLTLYVMSLSIIATFVRIIILERQENYDNLKVAKNHLEEIIISTNDLFKIENKLPDEAKEFSERYLRNMFDIACNIYPKFDKATCNIKEDKYVRFLGTKGYNMEELNEMKFLSKEFIWTLNEPEIVKNTDYDVVFEETSNSSGFEQTYGILKESIRFTVVIGENEYAGMSFDIFAGSEYEFGEQDVESFKSFQHLMNSYYKIGILNTQNNSLKDDIVLSLVRTLELYDLYTGGHSEEVAMLSVELARSMNLSEADVRELYWAGIVHDIGKIGLPYDVINKKGRLTNEEYELVKEHSNYGYKILSRSKGLKSISLLVKHHHEWWNGKGYPDGLRNVDIPYNAQILHVCDAVSAMAKDRVYKDKMTEDEIIKELQDGIGVQFSPKVAKNMIKYIQDGKLKWFHNMNNKEL